MAKKITIHEFNPEIYPLKIWIIENPTPKFLIDNFEGIDGEEFKPEKVKNSIASIWNRPVRYKKTYKFGIIVIVNDMRNFGPSSMAHEATHITNTIWEWIQEKDISMGSEVNAYLVGWIVKCMWEVKTNKI